jgi:hypothetical protein
MPCNRIRTTPARAAGTVFLKAAGLESVFRVEGSTVSSFGANNSVKLGCLLSRNDQPTVSCHSRRWRRLSEIIVVAGRKKI